jgi:outer membrane lipoprotein SlyB
MVTRTFLVLLAALSLAGCATGQDGFGGGATSPIQAQADDFKVTVVEGAVAGAVIGGVLGAIAGRGDVRRIAAGAAAGGVVGAVGGYVIAGQKQSYANREEALDGLVADSRQRQEKLGRVLATTERVVAQRRAELERLNAGAQSSEQRLLEQRRLLANLEADRNAVDQALSHARQHGGELDANINAYRQQFPGANPAPLQQANAGYRDGVRKLEISHEEIKQIAERTKQAKV